MEATVGQKVKPKHSEAHGMQENDGRGTNQLTRRGFLQGAALAPLALKTFPLMQGGTPSEQFDVVIAGAGHNSMVAAAYLLKAGYRCLLLEGRPMVGGAVKTAELTLKGFKDDVCSTAHTFLLDNPMMKNDELKLGDYGLKYIHPDPLFHLPFPDGSYLTMWRDLDRTCAELEKFSKRDAAAFRKMMSDYEPVKSILIGASFLPIGFGKPVSDQLAALPTGKLWQRRLAMSAWDILRETFEERHCLTLMLYLAQISGEPPTDPMTGRFAYGGVRLQLTGRPFPEGGSGMLTQALARFIEAHGGVILVNKPVTNLVIENGKCVGVECADGSTYRASKAVLSTIHIKQLVDMAPRDLWGADFIFGVNTWQAESTVLVTHYATNEPPKFSVQGGVLSPAESGLLLEPENVFRREYDNARGVVNLEDPIVQVFCPTVADPTRAPTGMHTIKVLGFQPYDLKEGPAHWDEIKYEVSDAQLRLVRKFAPNLTDDKILARFVTSPIDFERMNPHLWHGSVHAGAQTPSQSGAMRPMPGWAQHRMPIPGLYQTGATTYPGGSVTGAPGRNAAMVMLKDFGTSLEEVLNKRA
jgi:phytoene dehydrogenase-like protein